MGSACSLEAADLPAARGRQSQPSAAFPLRPEHERKVKARSDLGPKDLLEASLLGDLRQAGWVLEANVQAHGAATGTGWQPLHISAAQGHTELAQALLRRRADVNPEVSSCSASPLSLACLSGSASLVQLLLVARAALDGPEEHGAPLLQAAYKNSAEICEILLDSKANPHVAFLRTHDLQLSGQTAKHPAHEDHWHSVLCDTRQGGCLLQQLRVEGVTALHLAAWHVSVRICASLLKAAARPDARDSLERSALLLSAERGHVEVVRLLLASRAHLHPSHQGHTPASAAARAGQASVIQLLLEHRCDVDHVAWFGAPTMLHIAVHQRFSGLAAALMKQKASTEAALSPGGLRPLMVAASRGCLEVCQLLLVYKADVSATDDKGEGAWHKAVLAGHQKIGHLLAACGAAGAL